MDEFERIREIKRRLHATRSDILIGIGDDAAVIKGQGLQVLSVDTAVEGVHFRQSWATAQQIGYRCLVSALSDIAAMGAEPRASLLSLIVPTDLADESLFALADGVAEAAREYAAPVVGGNLSRGSELSVTCTVIGHGKGSLLTRSGARPGHGVWVTGTLGAAALGLHCLQCDHRTEASRPFIERWTRPRARVDEGKALLGRASAAIDVSDGLAQDLGHICRASAVGARVDAASLPLGAGFAELSQALSLDPLALALSGGDDYELLFILPETTAPVQATRIGEILDATEGLTIVGPDGSPLTDHLQGFRHWPPTDSQ